MNERWRLALTSMLIGIGLVWTSGGTAADAPETAWLGTLKAKYYGDKQIAEDTSIVELTAPYRAEDPALVPIQITSKIPQRPERYIKNITLFVDDNPEPFSAAFEFTPDSGKADVAMRIRVNSYTHVRAVAELNDGSLHMSKTFVKASGGCSAPIGGDIDAALARMGKMKFKLDNEPALYNQPNQVQLLISHPNITGLQMDQISRLVRPAHFVDKLKIEFNGKPVMTARTDIAISADPNFRFYFVPPQAGELRAEIHDNLGNQYTSSQSVGP